MPTDHERQHGKTVLLAEDDAGHARLIERNIAGKGIDKIIRLHDGQEALDFIRRVGEYSNRELLGDMVMLLDVKMPRIDGIAVLEQIKGDPATRWLPVVMFTTTDSPTEVKRCYQLGCSVYLVKPVEYNEFVESLNSLRRLLEVTAVVSESDV